MARDAGVIPRHERVAALDGVRAVAVLMVFAAHVQAVPTVAQGGFIGVSVFFVLSGFLITTILLQEFDRSGAIDLRQFYLRRFRRLLPALFVTVAVFTVVGAVLHIGDPLRQAALALLHLNDLVIPLNHEYGGMLSHTWSLALEEQFYLLWPVLLLVALRRGWPLRALVVVGTLATAALIPYGVARLGSQVYFSPVPHLPVLGMGVALAVLAHRRPSGLAALRRPAIGVVSLVLLLAYLPVPGAMLTFIHGGSLLVGLVSVLFVGHVLANRESVTSRVLSNPVAVWLGRRSYGFYLIHACVLEVVRDLLGASPWVVAPVGLAVSALLSEASWRWVEQPFLTRRPRPPRHETPPVGEPVDGAGARGPVVVPGAGHDR